MKRILAVFLTLAMALNIAPVGAFAEEPLLQEETAAFSLIQAGESVITAVKVQDSTATVTFSTQETAELVVAVYTDDTAREMKASGRAVVSGSGTKEVTITGTIPETYTLKVFLLSRDGHEALGPAYETQGTTVQKEYELLNQTLIIYQQSVLPDRAAAYTVPWYSTREMVWTVELKEPVTRIGAFSFAQTNTATVKMKSKVTEIGASAFSDCGRLKEVYYPGTMEEWRRVKIGSGNEALTKAVIHCADGSIEPAEDTVGEDDCSAPGSSVKWKLDEDGTLWISGSGAMKDYDLYSQTPWSAKKSEIKKAVIENSVTNVGGNAFSQCINLESVTLPQSITVIGNQAFYRCKNLQSVNLPEDVTEIQDRAFTDCEKLTSITIPEGVTSIGIAAFYGCRGLEEIILPNSVTSVGSSAFTDCYKLKHVVLSENLTKIEPRAFWNCDNLTEIVIPAGIESIGEQAFSGCDILASVTIPDSVTLIENGAFWNCYALETVTYLGTMAQWEQIPIKRKNSYLVEALICCTDGNITGIWGTCGADTDNVRWRLEDDGTLNVYGIGKMDNYSYDTSWDAPWEEKRDSVTKVEIQQGVTRTGDWAFASNKNTTSFVLADSVTEIGSGTFWQCEKLESIELPKGLTAIGDWAFWECKNLKNIVIPDGVTKIDNCTFLGCSSLESVTIPAAVTSIGEHAFNGCERLTAVNYAGTRAQWNTIMVQNANNSLFAATIHCTDGDIVPTAENSVTIGSMSDTDSTFKAVFSNAEKGCEYVVLVSRSGSDPLNADNLIYINQITADADGELAVPFITAADAAEMTYVVACAQNDATVDPDQPVDPGQPDQPDQPDQPGGDEPSSGGDGGGAAIILIGGVAAVAAVAGVVLLMPVKVEGTVKLADQPVANATVQVLKGDAVKAETVTDANGHFTVKVKRGGYTLRVQWTDASGQPVTRTVDFKAPNANLNVAA